MPDAHRDLFNKTAQNILFGSADHSHRDTTFEILLDLLAATLYITKCQGRTHYFLSFHFTDLLFYIFPCNLHVGEDFKDLSFCKTCSTANGDLTCLHSTFLLIDLVKGLDDGLYLEFIIDKPGHTLPCLFYGLQNCLVSGLTNIPGILISIR